MKKILIILFFIFAAVNTVYAAPALFFSDLIDGPNVGLTDDEVANQGAVVTIWGHGLGSSQGTSKVYVGSGSTWTEAAHVYYWGNADGTSNGTHADLYTKQGMQEISFAISSSTATGAQKIKVEVNSETSNELDFYVRDSGDIYFVKTTGNDSNNGSWATPWLTINHAVNGGHISAGDVIYLCNGVTASGLAIGSNGPLWGTANNMFGVIAYPGATVSLSAAISNYSVITKGGAYWVVSKMSVDTTSTGIVCTRYGRIVGNVITGDEADGQSGAIDGGYNEGIDKVSGVKVFGNHIHDYGNSSTSKKHHTIYFRLRYPVNDVLGIEVGWNYLINNHARYGIHYYDESVLIGSFNSPSSIHDNWIENQGGSGINIGTQPDLFNYEYFATGTWYVYNNVLVNCGLTADQGVGANPQAMALYGRQNHFDINVYNNVIYGYGDTGGAALSIPAPGDYGEFGGTFSFKNNIVADTKNFPYSIEEIKAPVYSSNNIWYNGGDSTPANAPNWDTTPISTDPKFTTPGSDFTLQSDSPAIDAGADVSSIVLRDFYGSLWTGETYEIGAIMYGESTPDTTVPEVQSFSINTAGTQATVALSESCTGNTGFTMTSGYEAVTLTYASGTGASRVYDLSRTVYNTTTEGAISWTYTPGDVADTASNAMVSDTGTVTNGSTQDTPVTAASVILRGGRCAGCR